MYTQIVTGPYAIMFACFDEVHGEQDVVNWKQSCVPCQVHKQSVSLRICAVSTSLTVICSRHLTKQASGLCSGAELGPNPYSYIGPPKKLASKTAYAHSAVI